MGLENIKQEYIVFGFMIFAVTSLGVALFLALICKKRVAAR
jgi:hypothetical protein